VQPPASSAPACLEDSSSWEEGDGSDDNGGGHISDLHMREQALLMVALLSAPVCTQPPSPPGIPQAPASSAPACLGGSRLLDLEHEDSSSWEEVDGSDDNGGGHISDLHIREQALLMVALLSAPVCTQPPSPAGSPQAAPAAAAAAAAGGSDDDVPEEFRHYLMSAEDWAWLTPLLLDAGASP
jgi:hypothetical protein